MIKFTVFQYTSKIYQHLVLINVIQESRTLFNENILYNEDILLLIRFCCLPVSLKPFSIDDYYDLRNKAKMYWLKFFDKDNNKVLNFYILCHLKG